MSSESKRKEIREWLAEYNKGKKDGSEDRDSLPRYEMKKQLMDWLRKCPKRKVMAVVGNDEKKQSLVKDLKKAGIISEKSHWSRIDIDGYIKELSKKFWDY